MKSAQLCSLTPSLNSALTLFIPTPTMAPLIGINYNLIGYRCTDNKHGSCLFDFECPLSPLLLALGTGMRQRNHIEGISSKSHHLKGSYDIAQHITKTLYSPTVVRNIKKHNVCSTSDYLKVLRLTFICSY